MCVRSVSCSDFFDKASQLFFCMQACSFAKFLYMLRQIHNPFYPIEVLYLISQLHISFLYFSLNWQLVSLAKKLMSTLLPYLQICSQMAGLMLPGRFDIIIVILQSMSNLQQEIFSLLKGLRNGLQYGSKVRFVHTLVMTLLFRDITLKQAPTLFKNICSMALEHGKNLGLFVLSYKAGYKLLNHLIKPSSFNHFLSGLIFGTLIFGKKSGVNHQIVLYLFSRVIIGLATLLYRKLGQLKLGENGKINFIEKGYGYYILSATCWGIVMWLFEKDKSTLQPSLKNSMEFLYKESDQMESLTELIPYYPNENKKKPGKPQEKRQS